MAKTSPDAQSYEALCVEIAPRMKALAAKLTGSVSMAEDVFQEAVLRVWQQLPRLQEGINLRAYFARVVTNLSVDTHRLRRRERKAVGAASAERLSALTDDSDEDASDEVAPTLREAIGALPPQQREALVLRYFEELGYPELARVLQCSEATARSHVSKAKAALKQRLRRLPTFKRFCRLED